jgi:hypothetical protein
MPRGHLWGAGFEEFKNNSGSALLLHYLFVQRSGDGDAESLLVLTPIMPPPAAYFISVISL